MVKTYSSALSTCPYFGEGHFVADLYHDLGEKMVINSFFFYHLIYSYGLKITLAQTLLLQQTPAIWLLRQKRNMTFLTMLAWFSLFCHLRLISRKFFVIFTFGPTFGQVYFEQLTVPWAQSFSQRPLYLIFFISRQLTSTTATFIIQQTFITTFIGDILGFHRKILNFHKLFKKGD